MGVGRLFREREWWPILPHCHTWVGTAHRKGSLWGQVHHELSWPWKVVSMGPSMENVKQGAGCELETGWKGPEPGMVLKALKSGQEPPGIVWRQELWRPPAFRGRQRKRLSAGQEAGWRSREFSRSSAVSHCADRCGEMQKEKYPLGLAM